MSDYCEPNSKRSRRKRIIKAPMDSLKKRQCRSRAEISLLELDDDCLCIVLEHLDVDSLCQMANVCKRIRPLTEEVFHRCHKETKIQVCHEMSVFRRILLKFGHSITAFHLTGHHCNKRMQIDVNAINKYCSNLHELHIYDVIIDCEDSRPLFARVSILTVRFCHFIGDRHNLFSSCRNVQKLTYSPDYTIGNGGWYFMVTEYPNLKEMAFFNMSSLLNSDYIKFLLLNPQLEKLTLMIIEEHIPPLLKYAPNLKNLYLTADRPYFVSSRSNELTYGEKVRSFDSKGIREISKMKNLEILSLGSTTRNSESDFIHLVTELPLLTRLNLNFEYEKPTRITVDGIKRIIEFGKQLDCLGLFGLKRLRIDLIDFEMLLKAVKSSIRKKKFSIFITGCKSAVKFNVPKAIQQAAKNHMEIFLNKNMKMDEDNRCMCKWCERKHTTIAWQEFSYV